MHPLAQVRVSATYWQTPATHCPGEEKVRTSVAETQLGAGAVSHDFAVPRHVPLRHASFSVQGSPSSQTLPSVRGR